MMEAEFNHLNHATWECKYHVVFTPKYRKKLLFGKIKRHLGQVFHDLARRKECRIGEGHLIPDPYADIDTSQAFGGADHRVYEREDRYGSRRMSNARCEISWATNSGLADILSRPSAVMR